MLARTNVAIFIENINYTCTKYEYLFTVEEVNSHVLSGISVMRCLYRGKVAKLQFLANKEIIHTHQGNIGNLCTKEIKKTMQ